MTNGSVKQNMSSNKNTPSEHVGKDTACPSISLLA
eukprot:CAMPEP_0114276930 /NCGR_PEP_ID=MMETSP0059-20121206/507_1 /TAXON_ID=36894 /ORGANISM="Pyramimonas parkeae, Strain CCMP726" /LENGTH=34 /DNA_ID= /DNA_START= /DNA_END= /DNA_ORIENTATION=